MHGDLVSSVNIIYPRDITTFCCKTSGMNSKRCVRSAQRIWFHCAPRLLALWSNNSSANEFYGLVKWRIYRLGKWYDALLVYSHLILEETPLRLTDWLVLGCWLGLQEMDEPREGNERIIKDMQIARVCLLRCSNCYKTTQRIYKSYKQATFSLAHLFPLLSAL